MAPQHVNSAQRRRQSPPVGVKGAASDTPTQLLVIYERLFGAFGPQHWWPGDGPTEIIIGAILTQNTNWKNVEKAIANLRSAGLIDWRALLDVPVKELAEQIRPAGYYNVKARRLKHFVEWLWQRHGGRLDALKRQTWPSLREELLDIHGIGPETADSILLYALDQPTFVVDAYTRRLAGRHGLTPADASYDTLKALFEENLPRDRRLFNEYHALIVAVAKRHCRSRASCAGCPLESLPHDEAI